MGNLPNISAITQTCILLIVTYYGSKRVYVHSAETAAMVPQLISIPSRLSFPPLPSNQTIRISNFISPSHSQIAPNATLLVKKSLSSVFNAPESLASQVDRTISVFGGISHHPPSLVPKITAYFGSPPKAYPLPTAYGSSDKPNKKKRKKKGRSRQPSKYFYGRPQSGYPYSFPSSSYGRPHGDAHNFYTPMNYDNFRGGYGNSWGNNMHHGGGYSSSVYGKPRQGVNAYGSGGYPLASYDRPNQLYSNQVSSQYAPNQPGFNTNQGVSQPQIVLQPPNNPTTPQSFESTSSSQLSSGNQNTISSSADSNSQTVGNLQQINSNTGFNQVQQQNQNSQVIAPQTVQPFLTPPQATQQQPQESIFSNNNQQQTTFNNAQYSTNQQQPIVNSQQSSANQKPQLSNQQQPIVNSQQSQFSNQQQPIVNSQQSQFSNQQQPIVNLQQFTNNQQPQFSNQQQPIVNSQQSQFSNHQQPVVNSQQSQFSNQQQPIVNLQQFPNNQQPQFSNQQQQTNVNQQQFSASQSQQFSLNQPQQYFSNANNQQSIFNTQPFNQQQQQQQFTSNSQQFNNNQQQQPIFTPQQQFQPVVFPNQPQQQQPPSFTSTQFSSFQPQQQQQQPIFTNTQFSPQSQLPVFTNAQFTNQQQQPIFSTQLLATPQQQPVYATQISTQQTPQPIFSTQVVSSPAVVSIPVPQAPIQQIIQTQAQPTPKTIFYGTAQTSPNHFKFVFINPQSSGQTGTQPSPQRENSPDVYYVIRKKQQTEVVRPSQYSQNNNSPEDFFLGHKNTETQSRFNPSPPYQYPSESRERNIGYNDRPGNINEIIQSSSRETPWAPIVKHGKGIKISDSEAIRLGLQTALTSAFKSIADDYN